METLRSIDPVQAKVACTPTPPLLSNKKHRLPLRADVGFSNTPPAEYQQKQLEIMQETEWEEASPRLIVLVTSDDLGTAVEENNTNIHGLPPYAGPELVLAKQRNNVHFDRNQSASSSSSSPWVGLPASSTANHPRYSMLAPPLDATFSATLGWRPQHPMIDLQVWYMH